MGCIGKIARSEAVFNGQGQFLDNLAGVGAYHGGTNNNAIGVCDNLDETITKITSIAAGNNAKRRQANFNR